MKQALGHVLQPFQVFESSEPSGNGAGVHLHVAEVLRARLRKGLCQSIRSLKGFQTAFSTVPKRSVSESTRE